MLKKSDYFKQLVFWSKIEFLVKYRIFCHKILVKKSKFWSKNRNFGQKSRYWSKVEIFIKNRIFVEKMGKNIIKKNNQSQRKKQRFFDVKILKKVNYKIS